MIAAASFLIGTTAVAAAPSAPALPGAPIAPASPAAPIAPGTPGVTGNLSSVACTSADSCEAVGSYEPYPTLTLAEVWNGTTWTVQPTPNPSGGSDGVLAGVACSSASSCVAVGGYYDGHGNALLAETWDGTSWSIQNVPLPAGSGGGSLASVSCTSSTSCTAVGNYANSSNTNQPLAVKWNGTSFSDETVPLPADASLGTFDAVACSPSPSVDCEAMGWNFVSGDSEVALTLAEGWNGTSWTIQSSPMPTGASGGAYPFGMSCNKPNRCTAVGEGLTGSGNLGFGWAQEWNGSSWSNRTTTVPTAATASVLSAVSCSAAPSTSCTAVGYYSNGETFLGYSDSLKSTTATAKLTKQPKGSTNAALNAVSCSSPPGTCSAVGDVTNKAGTSVTLANGWNGHTWSLQTTPTP